ncbi:hypothetical protein F4777DRAFT_594627 [Nemania sp. FL0916]|nr:hypothetical protein F4777DRAFT_594627 [Nemania sp. FL0916]
MDHPIRIRVRAPAPRSAARDTAARGLGPRVLNGCCIEAERADRVGSCLQVLRSALPEHLHPHLTAVIDQLQFTSRLLRDLADKSQVHLSQVPVMIDYLNVILPCLCRTLRDIMSYYEDKSMAKEYRWRTMYHSMTNELPGTTLPARFVMYNQFLGLLNCMLTRDPNFDVNAMEALRLRILQLREARKIDPPSPIRTDLARRDTALDFWKQETATIFTQPLPSRREFRKRGRSEAFGPLDRMGHVNPFPDDVKILVKRTFENDRISIIIFLRQSDLAPFILVRMRTASGEPWFCIRDVEELSIERETSSTLHLSYWNSMERRRKPWASLSFLTWEELVLFYCTFVCLKARSEWGRNIHRHEFIIRREKRIFQADIIDDNVDYSLVVVEDFNTKGRRLLAIERDGPLARCPVWTAFAPPEVYEEWLVRKDARKIWLRDLQVYSFCDDYQPHLQRRGKYGAFQIKFAHSTAATRFSQLFTYTPPIPPIPEPSVEDASDIDDVYGSIPEEEFIPSEE